MDGFDYRDPNLLRSDVNMLATRGARRFALYLVSIVLLFLCVFFFWASQATMKEITRGDGKVIPSGQNKVVQHLEGGIVRSILVREGDTVEVGDILMRIDSTGETADLEQKRKELYALQARAARLQAEADGKSEVNFPKAVMAKAPGEVASQRAEFRARAERLASELSVLAQQVRQREQELQETYSSVRRLASLLASMRKELQRTESDYRKGIVPRHDLEDIRRKVEETRGDLRTEQLKVPRIRSALAEANAKVAAKKSEWIAEVRKELSTVETKISALKPRVEVDTSRLKSTDIKSPVRGTIKQIGVTTIGAVVKPAQPLVEIVPLDDALLIEARINPEDRAFLRSDQRAVVKLTAFDFSIYGGLEGTVKEISADAIPDEKDPSKTYYRIRIRTKTNYISYQNAKLQIIPGMTASVDIQTGEKTVLDYLIAPIRKIFNESLSER